MLNSILSTLSVIILILVMFICDEWVFAGMLSSVYIVAAYAGYQYAALKNKEQCND